MAGAKAQINSNGLRSRRSAAWPRPGCVAILLAAFALVLVQFGTAGAQNGPLNPSESGDIGFAGMLAGLLVVALATLAVRHRGSESLAARLARVEALLEAGDDRIWAL